MTCDKCGVELPHGLMLSGLSVNFVFDDGYYNDELRHEPDSAPVLCRACLMRSVAETVDALSREHWALGPALAERAA